MMNLAGVVGCDAQVAGELALAGIEVLWLPEPRQAEVPTRVTGRIGPITLTRAWYYWIATGPVPLDVAMRFDGGGVRAGGDCARRGAAYHAEHFDANGALLESDPDGSHAAEWDVLAARHPSILPPERRPRFVHDAAAVAARSVVTCFHIDTQDGLCAFAEAVREAMERAGPGSIECRRSA